jgi:catalase
MKHILRLHSIVAAAFCAVAVSAAEGLTRGNGAPVGNNQNSRTAGPDGPVLLEDVHLIQKLQRFDRERIPERVVHARGTGAHGEFVSLEDLSAYTRATLFQGGGRKTPVFVRFSSVIHGQHSPETLRDPRGFATKFYTAEGNWDLVGNNLPVFFIRDALKFPDMVHSLKPSPVDNRQDPNRIFDFFSHVPESLHMFTHLYSDLGTPASYRQMDGNSVHAYKFVTARGDVTYVKFRWISQQGVKNFTAAEAQRVQGEDFNVHTTDLYAAINRGDFPSWELRVQLLKPEQLQDFDFDALDATKEWRGVPWKAVGKLTLNRMPENFFQETEQSAFAPGNLVPGIEPSEDRLLQGRIFSYSDTHLHRVGVNHLQLPINRPLAPVHSHSQDGAANSGSTRGGVNYEPSRGAGAYRESQDVVASSRPLQGATQQRPITKTLNFRQAGERYRDFSPVERDHLIANFAGDLKAVKDETIRVQIAAFAFRADPEYGTRLAAAANADLAKVQAVAAGLTE